MKKFICLVVFAVISASVFCEALFTGDGRKDFSVQVESPELHNIGDDSAWIPDFVVNTISDDIGKYSNITVVDVQNAKKVAETQKSDEKGLANDSDLVEAGAFMVARNVLLVSITQKPTSFALSVRINDKEKNISIASYSEPNCSYENLQSGLALKEAVSDLLGQLNVSLTAEGKQKLLAVKSVENSKTIEAQKLIAQGNVAKQNGSNVEALSYYIKANTNDSGLQRAIKAMSQTSTAMSAGNIGKNARNAIQQRKEFLKLFNEIKQNLKETQPFILVFNPDLKVGKIDYDNETVNLELTVAVVRDLEKVRVCNNVVQAFKNAPDSNNWGINPEIICPGHFGFAVSIADGNGKTIATKEFNNALEIRERFNVFADWNTFRLSIPAETDTSKLVLSIQSVSDEYGNAINISKLTNEDYIKVFAKSFAKEEIAPGCGIYITTLPIFILGNGYVGKSVNNFFMNYLKSPRGTLEKLAYKAVPGIRIEANPWAMGASTLEMRGIPREYFLALKDAMWIGYTESQVHRSPAGNYWIQDEYVVVGGDIGLSVAACKRGFEVVSVKSGSCCEKAGIQVGDILSSCEYDGKQYEDIDIRIKTYIPARTTVTFKGKRAKKKIIIPVEIYYSSN